MEEKKTKNKNGIIIGVIVTIVLLILILVISLFINNDKNEKDNNETNNKVEEQGKKDEKNEKITFDFENPKVKKIDSIPVYIDIYFTKVNSGNDKVYAYLYDGYYIVELNNTYYLKRNQKEVAKLEKNDKITLYKDKSDVDSLYIAICLGKDNNIYYPEVENSEYGFVDVNYESSMIYNLKSGKNKLYKNAVVSNILYINEPKFTIEVNGKKKLVNTSNLEIINSNYEVVGDSVSYNYRGREILHSNSSSYIIAKTNNKYGLIDFNGNMKLDFVFNDLITVSENDLIAKKGNKYGIIDVNNNVKIDFKYDFIDVVGDYYIIVVANKFGVIDKNYKELIPVGIEFYNDGKLSLRPEIFEENIIGGYEKDGKTQICYYISKDSDDNTCMIVGGKSVDFRLSNKIYNYSLDYYYYKEEDDGYTLYDKDYNLRYTVKNETGKNMQLKGFYDRDILLFDIEYGTEYKYYSLKENKFVNSDSNAIYEKLEENDIGFRILVTDNKKVFFNYSGEFMFSINKDDKVENVEEYYKVTHKDGSFNYYYIEY